MIKSFSCKYTASLFARSRGHRFPPDIERRALRKLSLLHSAMTMNDLRVPPANHLEILQGDRKGQYSIRINRQWRICFEWNDGDAFNVEIVDYH